MKQHKKSETLEVRLSHPDKTALQAKAAQEGRTVSDVVRGLISSYLAKSEPRSLTQFTELLMTLKRKPKSVLATLACLPLFTVPLFLPTSASAEDISLNLKGEFVSSVSKSGEDGKRVRRFNTEIHITPDNYLTMRMPSLLAQGPTTGLYMSVHVTEGEGDVILDMTICEIADAPKQRSNTVEMIPIDICIDANIIANPILTAKYGDNVEFLMGDESGETFRITALPRKL